MIFSVLKLIFIKLNYKQNKINILIILQVMKLLLFLIQGRVLDHGGEHGGDHGEEHGEVCEPVEQVWLERILHVPAQGRPRLPRTSRPQ